MAGHKQSAADQPNNLAEGHPPFVTPLLTGETHGTSGQCVSFSLIDAGSVLLSA
jgi:hypothetical protein